MRSRPEHIVEMLREAAEGEAEDVPGIPLTETITWEAADLIEWLMAALARIEAGATPADVIAAAALAPAAWRAAGESPTQGGRDPKWIERTTAELIAHLKQQG